MKYESDKIHPNKKYTSQEKHEDFKQLTTKIGYISVLNMRKTAHY